MNIYGAPTCTFTQFLSHLVAEGSGAANESQLIWDRLIQAKINPAVALGFFHHESQCGLQGRAAITKSWGNIRYRPIYIDLPFPVADVDGFCGYQSYAHGALHFAAHLLGTDGTNNYAGKTTVEQVVPTWAPRSDGNSPDDYINAVNTFAENLGGKSTVTKPKVLHVAGHLRTQQITEDGLCDGLDKTASAAALRGMTGTTGEQDFTSNMATLQADLMNATNLIEARAIDCTFNSDAYRVWVPNLVIAHHIHRDGQNRAMFAVPDNAIGYHSAEASSESIRFMARVMGGYTQKTGIPITQDAATLRMRQLYTWCYIDDASQAFIPEYGNGNIDTAALFNADSVHKIAEYFRDCVLEHFNLSTSPGTGTTGIPKPSPSIPPTEDPIVEDLRGIAQSLRETADQLISLRPRT